MPPRRSRILHVSRSLDMGGQERLLVEFAKGADRTRFDLHFLSLTGRGPIAERIAEHGWPVTVLEQAEGLRPGLVLRLARFFSAGRFDVVHTHDDKPLLYSAPAARLARIPRFLHTHHHGPLPHISSRQLLLTRLASYATDRFVCVSRAAARYVLAQGVPRRRVAVLHNGIDLAAFPFHGPAEKGPALCVARLSPEKDIANLLRAAALLRPRLPDFHLEIAGAGPLRDELARLNTELGLADRVRFLGEVRDIPALLARARLFVLPSQTEGISLTILEAMARGLPVVATDVGGNPEVVVPAETGWLAPAADPPRLAEALAALWRDPDTGRRFGAAARRRVEERFDVRRMIRRYEELYAGTPRRERSGFAWHPPAIR
ncbi:MAG: glycosyltransferase [Gemmataceae bacterium]